MKKRKLIGTHATHHGYEKNPRRARISPLLCDSLSLFIILFRSGVFQQTATLLRTIFSLFLSSTPGHSYLIIRNLPLVHTALPLTCTATHAVRCKCCGVLRLSHACSTCVSKLFGMPGRPKIYVQVYKIMRHYVSSPL